MQGDPSAKWPISADEARRRPGASASHDAHSVKVSASYDLIAAYYERWQRAQKHYADYVPDVLACTGLQDHPGGLKKALDLGCSSGAMTEALAERGFEVWGMDLSAQMIEVARARTETQTETERACESAKRPIHWIQGDFCDTSALEKLEGRKFDLILASLDTYGHVAPERLIQHLKQIKAFLAPAGILVFDVLEARYFTDVLPSIQTARFDPWILMVENEAAMWSVARRKEFLSAAQKAQAAPSLRMIWQLSPSSKNSELKTQKSDFDEWPHHREWLKAQLKACGFKSIRVLDSSDSEMDEAKRRLLTHFPHRLFFFVENEK